MLRINLTSNVGKINLDVIHRQIINVAKEEMVGLANRVLDEVKTAVEQQTYASRYRRLSRRYALFKKRHGLDERFYIATHELLDDLGVRILRRSSEKTESGTVLEISVGPSNKRHSPRRNKTHGPGGRGRQGAPYTLIWRALEYGVMRKDGMGWLIPPRPLWRNVVARLRRDLSKETERISLTIKKKAIDSTRGAT